MEEVARGGAWSRRRRWPSAPLLSRISTTPPRARGGRLAAPCERSLAVRLKKKSHTVKYYACGSYKTL
jgi:hypothetical protein